MGVDIIEAGQSVRWIAQVQDGVISMVQQIPVDAVVLRLLDLPYLVSMVDMIDDELAAEIVDSIKKRGVV